MSPRPILPLLLLLAACGTPQERCIRGVTQDLRVVNALVAETEVNLARGYRLEDVTIYRPTWDYCDETYVVTLADGRQVLQNSGRMCMDEVAETVQRPRAIDPAEERRKLANLQEQQKVLTRRAESAVAQCQALYPE
jgi:hypothetical protein